MKEKYICTKCGQKFYEKPIEHGKMSIRFFGGKSKPKKTCNGKIVKTKLIPKGEI
jgi:hypothetical protein